LKLSLDLLAWVSQNRAWWHVDVGAENGGGSGKKLGSVWNVDCKEQLSEQVVKEDEGHKVVEAEGCGGGEDRLWL
jgi:hypothetical protein